jgi:hypothetical protein
MSLASDWNSGGSALVPNNSKPGLRDILDPLHGASSLAALKAITPDNRSDGQLARVVSGAGAGPWRYSASSSLTGDDLLVATPADAPTAGRWLREFGSDVDLVLPADFNKADAAVLYTVPVGFRLYLGIPFWEVGTSWTGGASSAIGLSSSNAGLSTKGDLLGGASGDVAAGLLSTGAFAKGTIGAKMGKPAAVLSAGETIKFDRITSAFTAGAGNAHVPVLVAAVP